MMIFKVSSELKGSVVLKSIKAALLAGKTVILEGDDLYCKEVKAMVRNGILIPENEKDRERVLKVSSEVGLVNNLKKVLILNGLVIRPSGTLVVEKSFLQSDEVRRAIKEKFVSIVSFDKKELDKKDIEEETPKTKKKISPIDEKKEENTKQNRLEEGSVEPSIWDFREQSLEKAEPVRRTIEIKEEEENENKKETKKKVIQKKSKKTLKKKKVKSSKNKKSMKKTKKLEPVGEKREPLTVADAAMELDSRGKPLTKASDTLQHLVEEISGGIEVDFVDKQQEIERVSKRTEINLDLDS
ncbi:MAG TPA: hypothetical protein VMZ91_04525 [Candidatus Paceibacterota bacterium]|nr:hypothetical protein [Candidatus Paceibacterota bacterium]